MSVTDLINPSSHIGNAIHLLLTFLEKISEENFWKSILGERLVLLGQKYFGNDFVALSLAIYIAPILKTHWHNLIEMLFKKVINTDTVSVKIYSTNSLYDNISRYIFEHGPSRGNLTTGVAEYGNGCRNYTSTDYYGDDDDLNSEYTSSTVKDSECDDDSMKVKLLPPPSFVEEITYKGHVISASFVEYNEDIQEHIELTMRGTNTRLLHLFIQEWSILCNTTTVSKYVYRANGCCWNYERDLPERSLESVHLRDGQKEKLINDMETFRSRSEWYHKRGIPYRRGYLLYGPPGTGKSSIIQAIANTLGLHVAFSSLSGIGGNDTLSSLMSDLPYNSIMVIEDIDHLFESVTDKTKATSSSLTMSGLLNVLDGLQSQEGSMIFMTCNNIDKIQPALLRPGRIDLKFKLDYAAPEQIRDTFWRFMNLDDETSLPLEPEERSKVEKIALEFEKRIPAYHVTTAEIQGYFINLLLASKANDWSQENLHREIFERIPEFMKQVELDRTQAKKHSGDKDISDDKKDDKEEEKKDDKEDEKKDDKEEEKKDEKVDEKKDEKKDEKEKAKEEEKKEVKEENKEVKEDEVKKDEDNTKKEVEKTE
ncbi:hypothetical protein INT48_006804 [Thamnidium elegans]|uniref:AAA+ ATPase domain-containing protein n=1 Tax=Thamnidium elegans TaxID=101142 RepID=A0A8H7VTH0_9FUNG|nr:hypothetical protein INT48_006804 [Thamnidium elegans]